MDNLNNGLVFVLIERPDLPPLSHSRTPCQLACMQIQNIIAKLYCSTTISSSIIGVPSCPSLVYVAIDSDMGSLL